MEMTPCRVHKLVADVALLSDGKVALVKYKDASKYDNQPGWFLPDDFLEHLEHPDDAARRILKQQLGITVPAVTLAHIESFGQGYWHLVFHYRADLERTPAIVQHQNIMAAEWFPLGKLPQPSEVAHHGWALDVLSTITGKAA